MKLIVAYIQPHRLGDVKRELYREEVYKISVTNALGCGSQRGYHESYRGVDIEVNLLKKVRLEIAVNEDFVERTVSAIIRSNPAALRTSMASDMASDISVRDRRVASDLM